MSAGQATRDRPAIGKLDLVRTALDLVRVSRRASRERTAGGRTRRPRVPGPIRLRIVRDRG